MNYQVPKTSDKKIKCIGESIQYLMHFSKLRFNFPLIFGLSAPPALYWLCTHNHGIQFPFLRLILRVCSCVMNRKSSQLRYATHTSLYQSGCLHIIILRPGSQTTHAAHTMVCLWENVYERNGTFFNKMLKSEVLKAWRQSTILWDETRCRLYPQTLALTSPTSGGCSVGKIRSPT
jgi:hypothetical protein